MATPITVDGHPVDYSNIPGGMAAMREGVRRWIEDGYLGSDSFLRAVVSNDLARAVRQADDENILLLAEWVNWFRWNAPGLCHGSSEAVRVWAKARAALPEVEGDPGAPPPRGLDETPAKCPKCGTRVFEGIQLSPGNRVAPISDDRIGLVCKCGQALGAVKP